MWLCPSNTSFLPTQSLIKWPSTDSDDRGNGYHGHVHSQCSLWVSDERIFQHVMTRCPPRILRGRHGSCNRRWDKEKNSFKYCYETTCSVRVIIAYLEPSRTFAMTSHQVFGGIHPNIAIQWHQRNLVSVICPPIITRYSYASITSRLPSNKH